MHHVAFMDALEICDVARRFSCGAFVPGAVEEAASEALRSLRGEVVGYGFSEADVIRAILRPAFERKRGCDCPSCASRRDGQLAKQEEQQMASAPTA